jgi:hypothetical protein
MRFFYALLFGALCISETFAQRQCASTSYQNNNRPMPTQEQIDQQLRAIKKRRTTLDNDTMVYVIPVVVHVIHNTKGNLIGGANNRNITDEQIHSQIAVLNEDYGKIPGTRGYNTNPVGADTRLQFCLAQFDPEGRSTNGIIRVYSEKASFDYNFDDAQLKKLSYWPSDQYLNIWVTNITDPIIGYAQFPGGFGLPGASSSDGPAATDGVVIDFRTFGTLGTARKPYHLGRTATHEIGHWLGLIHIWGDQYCGDDYVDDTPPQEDKDEDTLCHERFSYCFGQETPRMFQNYLDYTGDKCMNIFTQGQKERMRSFINASDNARRKNLLLSGGCCNLPSYPFAQNLNFESGTILPEGWSISNPDHSNTWMLNSPGAYEQSSGCISIQNKYGASELQTYDAIVSPSLDFTENEHPYIFFDLAGSANTLDKTDSIVVEISFGCLNKKYLVKKIYGAELNTSRKSTSIFIPEPDDWRSFDIPLDAAAGQKRVRIYITSYGKAGTTIYLDNIKVYKASPNLIINPYPNPATDAISVDVIMEGESNVQFDLYNTLGQKILSGSKFEKTSFTHQFATSILQSGIYILTVSTSNQMVSKKIMITR